MKIIEWMTRAFPLWLVVASLLSFKQPQWFVWFSGPLIPIGLGLIMFSMGITLSYDDFKRVWQRPFPVFLGVGLQYGVMPFLGWLLAKVFLAHQPPFAVGLILVASCPGGVASNVITFLSKADVALSVSMTAISTLLAVLATPFLTAFYAAAYLHVPVGALLLQTLQVVILPVVAGIVINRYFGKKLTRVKQISPLFAVWIIVWIVASIIGKRKDDLLHHLGELFLSVFGLHLFGFLLGYVLSFIVSRHRQTARTISIEVGMQNSGLGVVLSRQFPDPLTALPSAISSIMHSLIGSFLAAIWRRAQSFSKSSDNQNR